MSYNDEVQRHESSSHPLIESFVAREHWTSIASLAASQGALLLLISLLYGPRPEQAASHIYFVSLILSAVNNRLSLRAAALNSREDSIMMARHSAAQLFIAAVALLSFAFIRCLTTVFTSDSEP